MKRLVLIRLGLLASLVPIACDDKSNDDENASDTGTEDGETDSTGSESGSTDADGSTAAETGEPMCPDPFPSFDKTCMADSDCALVLHTTDCCGTQVAWGIAASEVPAFNEVEMVCDAEYPACGCAPAPTMAEDGNSTEDWSVLAVGCQMGSCTSYVIMP